MAGHKGDHGNAGEGGHSGRTVVVAEIFAVPFCLGDKQKTDVAMTSSRRLLLEGMQEHPSCYRIHMWSQQESTSVCTNYCVMRVSWPSLSQWLLPPSFTDYDECRCV